MIRHFLLDLALGAAVALAIGAVLLYADASAQETPADSLSIAETDGEAPATVAGESGRAVLPRAVENRGASETSATISAPVVCSRVAPSGGDSVQLDDATVLALAVTYVAEAGWDAATDHAAISHVLKRKADRHHVPLLDVLVRYIASRRVTDTRRPWLYQLRLDATKPRDWPRNLSWAAHVDRWLACVERARAFLRGDLRDPCGAEHFGGVMDVPRGRMRIAACSGLTKNTFYTVGRR